MGWDVLTQSRNMAKDCDATAIGICSPTDARPVCDETVALGKLIGRAVRNRFSIRYSRINLTWCRIILHVLVEALGHVAKCRIALSQSKTQLIFSS